MQSYKTAAIVLLSKYFQLLCEEKLVYFRMIPKNSSAITQKLAEMLDYLQIFWCLTCIHYWGAMTY